MNTLRVLVRQILSLSTTLAACLAWFSVQAISAPPSVTEEFEISVFPSFQQFPDVSGDIVVWEDTRGGSPGSQEDIYGKNLTTGVEFPVSVAPGEQIRPSISGDFVVWQDRRSGNWDIWGKNLSTGTEFPISTASGDQERPEIDGNLVVWMDERSGMDIYGYDLSTHTEFPIVTAPGDQFRPAVSGDRVVWVDSRNNGIQGVNLTTNELYSISDTNQSDFLGPDIDGSNVVWIGERSGVSGIYLTDLDTGIETLVRAQSETTEQLQQPVVQGSLVLWVEGQLSRTDIYGEDVQDGTTFPINNGPRGQYYPAIDGDIVVWTDTRIGGTNDPDIFGARIIPEPTTCTLALVGLCLAWRRHR